MPRGINEVWIGLFCFTRPSDLSSPASIEKSATPSNIRSFGFIELFLKSFGYGRNVPNLGVKTQGGVKKSGSRAKGRLHVVTLSEYGFQPNGLPPP